MGTLIRLPARGHYLAWEAGQLAGVSGNKIGQWARRGYIVASPSADVPEGLPATRAWPRIVVHDLLERGVVHGDIRTAIAALHDYGDWPLTGADLGTVATHGKARLVAEREGIAYEIGERGWQRVVNPEHLSKIRSELQRGGWAVEDFPGSRTSRSIPTY